ncbi:MAG: carboxypeptidase regulatory-like domain-containing protein [Phaeodactylibacter sp.]|nr:carboxypeptidase regulatory-like domain-containing protein [Phaeodactylibacter sp.]
MRLRFYLSIGIFLNISIIVTSQPVSFSSVQGVVTEKATGQPLEFADVALLDAADASFVHGTATNRAGEFRIAEVPPGQYILQLNFIGFETKETAPFSVTGQKQELNLGKIPITVSRNLLDEVEVTAERSTYNLSLDRKIYTALAALSTSC